MKNLLLKPFFSFSLLIIVAAGWSQPNYSRLATAKTFSQLPLVATGKLPDLILTGDSVPHPYIRTHIVEVDFSTFVSSNDLIKAIQAKGKEEGVDGILLLGLGDNRPPTQSYTTDNRYNNNSKTSVGEFVGNVVAGIINPNITYSSGFSSIKGIGIKYTDSINYLDVFIRKRTIQLIGDNRKEASKFTLNYDIEGTLHAGANDVNEKFFTDSILPFDVQMAINQVSNNYAKKFVTDVDNDQPLLAEINGIYGVQNVSYHVKDLQRNTSFKAIVTNDVEFNRSREKYQIQPNYNTNNILNGATISKDGKPLFVISYQLGNKNTVQQEDWQKWEDGKLIPWVKISNEYFTNDSYKNGFK